MEYYVYVYLDPNKPGKYQYPELTSCFLFEPFYVGKGTRMRDTRHIIFCKKTNPGTNPFYDKLNSLKEKPIIERIVDKITDQESQQIEKIFIKNIGRKLKKEGPLMNMTDGGTGGNTLQLLSPEKRTAALEKRSKSMLGKNKKPCSEEQKKQISKTLTGRKNPEHSKRMFGRKATKETINKQSKSLRKYYKLNKSHKNKKLVQLTEDNKIIKIWDSKKEAVDFYNLELSKMWRATSKKISYNGYKWTYL